MNPRTYLVDFMPTITKETPAQLKRKEYGDGILGTYDLGEVIPLSLTECKKRGPEEKPDVIICTYEYEAREIKELVPEAVLYVVDSVNSVFSRKAEIEEKMEENTKKFKDAEETVQRIRDASDEEREQMRKFHAMSYDEVYKMITQAIISDNEDLRKKAWDLLWGPGEKNSNIIWMRVQMMAEVWEHSKGKQLEQLMLMSMERHIELGVARKMDNFTDADGQEYHQYMFLDPFGNDFNYIRRLPFATKDQERYGYERVLEESGIPANYMRVQLEATQFRKELDEYLEEECKKVQRVLEEYEKNPRKSRKELGVVTYGSFQDNDSLTEEEIKSMKEFISKHE